MLKAILLTVSAIGFLSLSVGIAGLAVFTDQANVTGNTFTTAASFGTPTPTPAPTTASFGAVADSYLREAAPDSNFGTSTSLDIESQANAKNRRGLVLFDLSSIPAGSTINSATLTLCKASVPSVTRTYEVHRVTASWGETAVTWNNQPTVAAAATDSVTTPPTLGCVTWTVTADVQAWVDGTANNGWRISDSVEESVTAYKTKFRSREEAVVTAERPKLDVTYTPP